VRSNSGGSPPRFLVSISMKPKNHGEHRARCRHPKSKNEKDPPKRASGRFSYRNEAIIEPNPQSDRAYWRYWRPVGDYFLTSGYGIRDVIDSSPLPIATASRGRGSLPRPQKTSCAVSTGSHELAWCIYAFSDPVYQGVNGLRACALTFVRFGY